MTDPCVTQESHEGLCRGLTGSMFFIVVHEIMVPLMRDNSLTVTTMVFSLQSLAVGKCSCCLSSHHPRLGTGSMPISWNGGSQTGVHSGGGLLTIRILDPTPGAFSSFGLGQGLSLSVFN